jgi:colicin import membrane protein
MSAAASNEKPKRVLRSAAELANQYNRNLSNLLRRAEIPKGQPGSMVHRSTNRSVSVRAASLRRKAAAARNRATKKNAKNAKARSVANARAENNDPERKQHKEEAAAARKKEKAQERKEKEASLLALTPRSMERQINAEAAEAARKRIEKSAKAAENARLANEAAMARIEELAAKKKELLRRKAEIDGQGRRELEEKCAALQRLKNREARGE